MREREILVSFEYNSSHFGNGIYCDKITVDVEFIPSRYDMHQEYRIVKIYDNTERVTIDVVSLMRDMEANEEYLLVADKCIKAIDSYLESENRCRKF
jgi:predicted outer membrane repeat protein